MENKFVQLKEKAKVKLEALHKSLDDKEHLLAETQAELASQKQRYDARVCTSLIFMSKFNYVKVIFLPYMQSTIVLL